MQQLHSFDRQLTARSRLSPADCHTKGATDFSKECCCACLLHLILSAPCPLQQHTVRGAFAGSLKKKLGLTIISSKDENAARVYRIASD